MPPHIPQYHELMWPALIALKELGGSAKVKEMYKQVVDDEHFSEEQQEVSTKDGRMSEIEYRLHWARTHLKGIGAMNNSTRGVWTITDKGKTITPEQMAAETKEWRSQFPKGKGKGVGTDGGEEPEGEESTSWKDCACCSRSGSSAGRLGTTGPANLRFERFGFSNVTVTGKSGDSGIDGVRHAAGCH